MAIGASNLTFEELRLNPGNRIRAADHVSDLPLFFAADVVEFKDHGIALAAIDAGMRCQIFTNEGLIARVIASLIHVSPLVMFAFILVIVPFGKVALAWLAITVPCAGSFVPEAKLIRRLILVTFSTPFHALFKHGWVPPPWQGEIWRWMLFY